MKTQLEHVQTMAGLLLQETADPVVHARLMRDVLRYPPTQPDLVAAARQLTPHPNVQVLAAEQWPDGSWGRLHSQDVTAGQRIRTTEFGVSRALALGLDPDHPILQAAANCLGGILSGRLEPRDPPEKNDRWPTGVQLFAAATLALIRPDDPLLDDPWALWLEIAQRSFAGGRYDDEAERRGASRPHRGHRAGQLPATQQPLYPDTARGAGSRDTPKIGT